MSVDRNQVSPSQQRVRIQEILEPPETIEQNNVASPRRNTLMATKVVGLLATSYAQTKRKRKKKFERKRSKAPSVSSDDGEFGRHKVDGDSESEADIYGSLVSMVTIGKSAKTERKLSIHECIRKRSFRYVKKCLKDDSTAVHRSNKQGIFPLHVSAQYGYLDIVQLLLDNGADVNIATKTEGITPLHLCCKNNHSDVLQALVLHGCSVNAKGVDGQSALHVACQYGFTDVAKKLLDAKADVNATNEDKQTPLHLTAMQGSVDMARLLISKGADVLSNDCNKNTPLMFACSAGHIKIAAFLTDHAFQQGACIPDYLNKQNNRGDAALHLATVKRHEEIVRFLLQNGSDVTSIRVNGQSALHIAAFNGSTQIALDLLNHGALLTLADNENMSPLHIASLYNQVETMKLLMDKGDLAIYALSVHAMQGNSNYFKVIHLNFKRKQKKACSPDICDEDGYTPLMCAAWKGNCEAGNLLINEGAAIDTTDSDSKTCLHMAVEMDHVNFVKMLLQKDCDYSFINATSKHEWTALHFAAENGNIEILQYLLVAGANIAAKDNQERTPLHVAASFGRLPFIEAVLVEKPDLINESDKSGMTPLLLASKHDHHHVVRYLIKMGADISSRNSSEMTALSLAAMKGNVHVITVLLQFNVNVNAQDKDWNTPLHICCIYDQEDSADLLLNANANICILNRRRQSVLDLAAIYKRDLIASSILKSKNWEKAMTLRDCEGNTPLKMLIETLPKCAEIVLDRCIHHSHSDHTRPDYAVTYDFRYLDPGPDDISMHEQKKRYFATQTMIQCNREGLTQHELVQALMRFKWNKFGRAWTIVTLATYMVYIVIYLVIIQQTVDHELPAAQWMNNTTCPQFNHTKEKDLNIERINDRYIYGSPWIWWFQGYMLMYIAVETILKAYEVSLKRLDFCMDIFNWNDFISFISTLIFIIPPGHVPCAVQWNFGVLGIFTANIRLISMLQRIDVIGIYVTMFWTTVKSLLKAMVAYILFIIAFAISFRITFNDQWSYGTEWRSFLTTFSMTMGEFGREYVLSHVLEIFQSSANVLFFLFLFLMPLVLVNLMIGISIGDIEAIRNSSFIKRLAMQIDVTSALESKLPMVLQRKIHSLTCVTYPNKPRKGIFQKVKYFLFGEYSSAFISDDIPEDNTMNDSIEDIKESVDTQKDFQSVVLIVLQQHGDILRDLARKNGIFTDNLDNVSFLVKGHTDMVFSRKSSPS